MPLLKTMTGDISYKSEQGVLTALVWGEKYKDEIDDEKLNRELAEYFNGQLQSFSLDVLPSGTDYQKKSLASAFKYSIWSNGYLPRHCP